MAAYIDKFQSYMAELEVLAPQDYSAFKKKRMLLANIRDVAGVTHLIQKCRDEESMTYDQCAAYLRRNAILIDKANMERKPSRLMYVEDSNQAPEKSVDDVMTLFQTMAEEGGLLSTYRMFNTRTFRDSMSIPDKIWKEMDPIL